MARCKAIRVDGRPCRAPDRMLDAKGLCPAHRPGATERLREAGRKGAEVSIRLKQKATGLSSDELPSLDSPQAAATWLEAIGRAVACGRLANRDAIAATKAVREWLRAHEAGAMAEQVGELRRKVEELKKDDQPEVVK